MPPPAELPIVAGQPGSQLPAALADALAANPLFAVDLFDALPDVVFFIKDAQGRYAAVNQTLLARCGARNKAALIGRTAPEVFGAAWGEAWLEQDRAVLAGGADIVDRLELHLYPDRDPGWCLTRKLALRGMDGTVAGLCGISRDLAMADRKNPAFRKLEKAVRAIEHDFASALQIGDLAQAAGMSVSQLERYCVRIFQLTPRQMIVKARIGAASRLLAGTKAISYIAQECGYSDHSAFSRQFKATVGVTPADYRAIMRAT
jgi:AraC-like DNA-binding protein